MIATVINALAVLIGSLVGVGLKGKIHDQYEDTVFNALGIFTLVLGFSMALQLSLESAKEPTGCGS